MARRLKKSTTLPVVLLIYLAVMAYIGWGSLKAGQLTLTEYLLILFGTLACIILLHVSLKRRERLRREREEDIRKNDNQ